MSPPVSTQDVVATSKWIAFCDHLKNNRIEYLLLLGVTHLMGLTGKAYDQVSGVCL